MIEKGGRRRSEEVRFCKKVPLSLSFTSCSLSIHLCILLFSSIFHPSLISFLQRDLALYSPAIESIVNSYCIGSAFSLKRKKEKGLMPFFFLDVYTGKITIIFFPRMRLLPLTSFIQLLFQFCRRVEGIKARREEEELGYIRSFLQCGHIIGRALIGSSNIEV